MAVQASDPALNHPARAGVGVRRAEFLIMVKTGYLAAENVPAPTASQCHHTARESSALDVGAQSCEVVDVMAVVDAHDVLFDDRPFIKGFGDVVRRGADEFDVAFLGAPIRGAPMNAGPNE